MKIYAYKLTSKTGSDIKETSEEIMALSLPERVFAPRTFMRLEHRLISKNLIFLDFAKARRGHGPGKISKNKELTDIGLADDEAFGEDTGLALDLASGFAAIQFNSSGPRAIPIADYLSSAQSKLKTGSCEADGFSFSNVLTDDALHRLKSTGIIKSLEFDVALPGVTGADLERGSSLSQVLDCPFPEGTGRIRVIIKAFGERGSGLERGAVENFVGSVLDARNLTRALKVSGRDEHGKPIQPIDFLHETLMIDVPLELKAGQRYDRSDRWNALDAAMAKWKLEGRY